MTTVAYTTAPLLRLTDAQRSSLMADLARDGFVVLPGLLPQPLIDRAVDAIDRVAAGERAKDAARVSVKVHNIVDIDSAFRELMMYEPALQLAYDSFGPMFHLCQSNLVSRPRDPVHNNFLGSAPWHADGPRPAMFPKVGDAVGMHYLKFGFFLTDLTHGNGGSLQVVRGSHLRPELDGKMGRFYIEEYADDMVQVDCPAGSVIAFHQAQWHAAPPNYSDVERKNCYISYCPTWMKPIEREYPTNEQLDAFTPTLTPEQRWMLGEPRPAMRWWLPTKEDSARMARFMRDGANGKTVEAKNYE